MHIYITTWDKFLESIDSINLYLDEMEARGKKRRLAFDTETYIPKESRDAYDLEYTNKHKFKKDEPRRILKCPKYPVPRPVQNKWGHWECRIRLIQIGLDPRECDVQYILDVDKIRQDFINNTFDCVNNNLILSYIFDWYKFLATFLKPLLQSASLLGQNLGYEYGIFWHYMYFNFRLGEVRDLLLMSQIAYNGDKLQHGLSYIYEKNFPSEDFFKSLTGKGFSEYHKFKKDEQQSPWWTWDLTEDQIKYAAEDIKLPWYPFERLYKVLQELDEKYCSGKPGKGVLEVVRYECELLKVVAKMALRGFKVDHDYYFGTVKPWLQAKADKAIEELQKVFPERPYIKKVKKKKKIYEGKGKDKVITHIEEIIEEKPMVGSYNPRSWQQIREMLGMPDKASLETTSENDLRPLVADKPWVKYILDYKKAMSFIGKFESDGGYITFSQNPEHLIHCSLYQIGQDEETVDTGRMSSAKPALMCVPAQDNLFHEKSSEEVVRQAFIGRDYCIIKGKFYTEWEIILLLRVGAVKVEDIEFQRMILFDWDYSQIEPRLQAWHCKDSFLMKCYKEGLDMHAITSQKAFNLDYLPLDKQDPWRKKGKICRLGTTYGMGVRKYTKFIYDESKGEIDFFLQGEAGLAKAQKFLDTLKELHPETEEMKQEIERDVAKLPYKYGGLSAFRDGSPYYVSVTPVWERTRLFCLKPEERTWSTKNPFDWSVDATGENPRTGKISTFFNKLNSKIRETARVAFNNRIQGAAADLFKLSLIETDKQFEELHDKGVVNEQFEGLVLPVHDQCVGQARQENAELMSNIVKETMIRVGKKYVDTVPIEVEGSLKINWYSKLK